MSGLTDSVVQNALDQRKTTGDSLGTCLLSFGWADEECALRDLADWLGIRFIDLSEYELDRSAAADIPAELIQKTRVVPVSVTGDQLTLAMENPLDFQTLDHIEILTGKKVERVLAIESYMRAAMQQLSGHSVERMIEHMNQPGDEGGSDDSSIGHLREIASEPTVVNLVNLILLNAIRDRASDIHIEPYENKLKVKYRVDGILHEMPMPPKHLHDAIISRVKIMAEMNIAERYIPQDGHMDLHFDNRNVDVRVATLPTIHGESVVMRLLDKTALLFGLDNLGFEEDTLARYKGLLKNPHGIVLVCGPTGSGKTSTLYASLNAIYTSERKFITIEDPVEYELEGVNQIPIRVKRGLTFATGLRAIVRQDPDVIMVGEIRDSETAEIAIRSALTGHLVLSSLHTNDAPASVSRLTDMGIQPYLIASGVRGVLGQRLVRRVCKSCRKAVEPTEDMLDQLHTELGDCPDAVFYAGKGCKECNDTGYRGRIAIHELMLVDEGIRAMILNRASGSDLREHIGSTMQSFRQAGWMKVIQGITTLEEINRVTFMPED